MYQFNLFKSTSYADELEKETSSSKVFIYKYKCDAESIITNVSKHMISYWVVVPSKCSSFSSALVAWTVWSLCSGGV